MSNAAVIDSPSAAKVPEYGSIRPIFSGAPWAIAGMARPAAMAPPQVTAPPNMERRESGGMPYPPGAMFPKWVLANRVGLLIIGCTCIAW